MRTLLFPFGAAHQKTGHDPMTWSYYPDYDSRKGVRLRSIEEKINYLEGRTEKILLKPLREVFKLRGQNEAIWDLNICVAALICEGISGLSTYYGSGFRGERFECFVRDFLYPGDPSRKRFSSLLWEKVRCSLSHGLYIEGGWIETDPSQHFLEGPDGKLTLDLESFFKDFEAGVTRFFQELRVPKSHEMISTFETRFNEVFTLLV